jgi:hypothetical protein
MEELKMHEQDDIVPPHTISMDNMVAGGVAILPQEVSVRSASSLAPTACAPKSCGQKILGGQQPPLHGRRPGKSLGPADAAANLLATVVAQQGKRQQATESLAQMEVADRAERRKHEMLMLERTHDRDLQRDLALHKATSERDLLMQTTNQTFLTGLLQTMQAAMRGVFCVEAFPLRDRRDMHVVCFVCVMIDSGVLAQMHAQLPLELSSIQEVEYDGGSEFQSESGDDNYTFESGDDDFESGHVDHTSDGSCTVLAPHDVHITISSDESVSIVYAESEEALLSQDSTLVDLTLDDQTI